MLEKNWQKKKQSWTQTEKKRFLKREKQNEKEAFLFFDLAAHQRPQCKPEKNDFIKEKTSLFS